MGDKEVDAVKQLADSLREKKGVPWSVAKLDVGDGDSTYVEFFRGKDFARFFRSNPEKLSGLVPLKPGKTVDDQIADLMVMFLKRKFVRKTERKYKKPKPGKKRLVKFPKTLEPHPDPSGWTENAFYAWTYDRPTSLWYHVGTIALPVVVIAACLFPLAPWWMRMTLVYLLMAILAVLLGLISLRYVLFGIAWIVTGNSFWLFPNLMSEEVTIFDAFSPVVSYDRAAKGKKQWLARLATLLVAGGMVYVLYQHSPDAEHLKQQAKEAHDSILDYLDVYGKHSKTKGYITNGTTNGTGPGAGQQRAYNPGSFAGGFMGRGPQAGPSASAYREQQQRQQQSQQQERPQQDAKQDL